MYSNNIIDKVNLINNYTMFHPNPKRYTFFSILHGTFSKIYQTERWQSKSQQIKENWNNIRFFFLQKLTAPSEWSSVKCWFCHGITILKGPKALEQWECWQGFGSGWGEATTITSRVWHWKFKDDWSVCAQISNLFPPFGCGSPRLLACRDHYQTSLPLPQC